MKIFALNDTIIFECDWCGDRLDFGAFKSKRAFVTKMNRFHRNHGYQCQFEFNRKESISQTFSIIEKLKANI